MKKLNFVQIVSISMMLFAIFFGAGNMIFPPAMGQLAGSSYPLALLGFILTDVGIAIMGIAAVVFVGSNIDDIGRLISPRFGLFFSIAVYLLIGPLFGLPRTATVSFEITFVPYLPKELHTICLLIFSAMFFALTYYLSHNSSKLVDYVGKILTPLLLVSIFLIFIMAILHPEGNGSLAFGEMMSPSGDYRSHPLFLGMIEGYNALDGPAGLAFAVIVIEAIRLYGVRDEKSIVKYTLLCGLGSAVFLTVIYFMLTHIGAITNEAFANGGNLLHAVTYHLLGNGGGIVLGVAVFLACIATAIGLVSSFSRYIAMVSPESWTYQRIAKYVCFASFIIANVGLNQLIKISLPILMMIYPVTIVLIVLSFMKNIIKERRSVYIISMILTFIVSFINGVEIYGVKFGIVNTYIHALPFNDIGFGWISVSIIGALIGFLPIWNKLNQIGDTIQKEA